MRHLQSLATVTKMTNSLRVVVLGASPKPHRYAFKAMKMLRDYGHKPIPVNPAFDEVQEEKCYPTVSDVPGAIDTITVYVGRKRSDLLIEQITSAAPRRIILNPGAENEALGQAAEDRGIEVIEGCTLVMLTSGTF
ncbi:MAG TPA: CoA-binding protein [Chthoniobacterales bacterium]